MADLRLSALALSYVHVPVRDVLGDTDLSATAVQLAFVGLAATPDAGDWKAGDWRTDEGTSPPTYYARCLVGPAGSVALPAGAYSVWVKVTDSPEVPVLKAPGQLVVF